MSAVARKTGVCCARPDGMAPTEKMATSRTAADRRTGFLPNASSYYERGPARGGPDHERPVCGNLGRGNPRRAGTWFAGYWKRRVASAAASWGTGISVGCDRPAWLWSESHG